MTGAESLVRTLVAGGVEVCFTNPGTSEMHFVAALDHVDGMRCVLSLFEGVAVGAADGYARMAGKPAMAMLHLGGGLGNGLSNLHNAQKARTPLLTVVGDHATGLTRDHAAGIPSGMDIAAAARPYSDWVRVAQTAEGLAGDGAAALVAANSAATPIATLVAPADTSWNPAPGPVALPPIPVRQRPSSERIAEVAKALRSKEPALLVLLGADVLRGEAVRDAGRIAASTGCRIATRAHNARIERGAGRVPLERQPYPIDQALAFYRGVKHVVLVGSPAPVANFAYPGKPFVLTDPASTLHVLSTPEEDGAGALAALAAELGATRETYRTVDRVETGLPTGALGAESIAQALAALLPEGAIVIDESITVGRNFYNATRAAPSHDWLQNMGGAIGVGMSLAAGAALACPGRPTIALEGDGCALYMPQSLWMQARENLHVVNVIFNNRAYAILKGELGNVGCSNPGRRALDMTELDRPQVDFMGLAQSMGVAATRVDSVDAFTGALRRGLVEKGPHLIEVML